MKQFFCLAALILLTTLPAFSQISKPTDFIIKGQVVDSLSGETVPYATLRITLTETPDNAVRLLACDLDGNFETSIPDAGNYTVTIQSVGKANIVKTFTLSEGSKTLNFGAMYMQDQNELLGEVTIVAQKPLVRVEIDKLTYSLQDDPEALTSNTLDMLRKVPMVTVDGEDNIQLKGSSNYKIYINGKPSSLLTNNPSDVLKSMPANTVKSIEVITDPGAKYDAEGIGGIINIITDRRTLDGYTGSVRANASSIGRLGAGAYLSLKAGKFGITANGNYHYNDDPWNESILERNSLFGETPISVIQEGRSTSRGPFQYGNLELSYEIDTLNLLSVGVNRRVGGNIDRSEYDVQEFFADDLNSHYLRNGETKNTFGSTDVNVDFQHSTQKKDEILTLSYRFSNSPNDSENNSEIINKLNYYDSKLNDKNKAYTNEHTAQIDYTTPFGDSHTVEVGGKYILRQNNSETERFYEDFNPAINAMPTSEKFNHIQHIYSAYAGHAFKVGNFGTKVGVRAEGTSLDVEYKLTPEQNFDNTYFDIVPNATVSYMLSMAQQLRVGYNMRIQRPGIWFLNPYINQVDPKNISYGNPNLDSEKSHNFNLNYSMFSQKLNVNASLSYSFVDNSIEQYTFINEVEQRSERTFGNIGKRNNVGLFGYLNWRPTTWYNLYFNGGTNYTEIKSEARGLSNSGFSGNLYAGMTFNLPKNFRVNTGAGYNTPRIMLQSERNAFHFHSMNASKDFLDKKLTVTLFCNSPLRERHKSESTTTDINFSMKSTNYWTMRDFGIYVSYRFGSLNSSIKKVRRGITNDDSKQGEGDSGSSMGQ